MSEATALNVRHLRIFAKVAELRGIRKAADAVSLSQPAVTQAIAKLEQQVAATLFKRSSNGTYLTEAGNVLAFRTGLMINQIEAAVAEFGVNTNRGQTLETVIQRITRPQIRVLTAVATTGSFSDAAHELGISQVSLHRAARELERNLGKPLFDHSEFGVRTTQAASSLARRMSLAMREIEWALDEIHAVEGRLGGELRVGAMPIAGGFLLGATLNDLSAKHPEARVHVRTGDGRVLANALRIGEIDFIVGMSPNTLEPAEIKHETLISSPFILVARHDHPLSRKEEITISDLEVYDWIWPTRGATRRGAFDDLFAQMKKPPRANIEANSLATIRTLIGGTDRLTLLTRYEYENEGAIGTLMQLAFPPVGPIQSVDVVWRAGWTPTTLHLTFLEFIRARAARARGSDARLADGELPRAADRSAPPPVVVNRRSA